MAVFKTKLTKHVVTTYIFLEVINNKYWQFVCEYDKNMLHMHNLFPRSSSWLWSYDSRIYTINSSMLIAAKVSVNSIYYSNTNKQKYYDIMIIHYYVLYKVAWCSWPLGFFVVGGPKKIREVTSTRLLMQVGGFLRFPPIELTATV